MKKLNSSGNKVASCSPRQSYFVHNVAVDLKTDKWTDKGFSRKWVTIKPGQSIAVLQ